MELPDFSPERRYKLMVLSDMCESARQSSEISAALEMGIV